MTYPDWRERRRSWIGHALITAAAVTFAASGLDGWALVAAAWAVALAWCVREWRDVRRHRAWGDPVEEWTSDSIASALGPVALAVGVTIGAFGG